MNPSTATETILVVDDHGALCELMEVILCSAGYVVLSAGNGSDALRLARTTPRIDLLLSELDMPRMRGDELATRVTRLHPWVPVVLVSGSIGRIETTDSYHFLPKPFTVSELRDTVRRALQRRRDFAETSHAA